MGVFSAKRKITSQEMPASLGVQGPGEMTIFSGLMSSISSRLIWLLRKTSTFVAQLAEIMIQVVGEGVVVVDKQNHFFLHCSASSTAFSMARALFKVS